MEYPEHEKMKAIETESLTIGSFLEWLQEKYEICEFKEEAIECIECGEVNEGYTSAHRSIEKWLAEYFKIDLKVVEKEKQSMLDSIREGK